MCVRVWGFFASTINSTSEIEIVPQTSSRPFFSHWFAVCVCVCIYTFFPPDYYYKTKIYMQQPIMFRILCECIVPVSSLLSACPPHFTDNNKQDLSSQGEEPLCNPLPVPHRVWHNVDSVWKAKGRLKRIDNFHFCPALIFRHGGVSCPILASSICSPPITTIVPLTRSHLPSLSIFSLAPTTVNCSSLTVQAYYVFKLC